MDTRRVKKYHLSEKHTQVKGTGAQEGLTIFCTPGNTATNTEIVEISNRILSGEEETSSNNNNGGTTTTTETDNQKQVPELVNQQGPWNCICGVTNEEGTIRCEACFGWREASETTTTTTTKKKNNNNTEKKPQYYTKMRQVIGQILKKESDVETKAAKAYEAVIADAMELFGESTTTDNHGEEEEEGSDEGSVNPTTSNHNEAPMSPTARMTRQRFSDIAWKENRTHYEKSSSRVGVEYQVDVLPVVGSHTVPEEEVL